MKQKHFSCSCGWGLHALHIVTDSEDQFPYTSITIVNAPADLSLWQRIKSAWFVLIGNEHILSEVNLEENELKGFIDFVVSLSHNSKTK